MKKLFFVAFFILSTFSFLKAQSSDKYKNEIILPDERLPHYIGGESALKKFINENIKYPDQAVKDSIQGKVVIEYLVDTNGVIRDVKILKSLSKECDEEVLRVMSIMPPWKPGRQHGKAVTVRFEMPVIFKLPN